MSLIGNLGSPDDVLVDPGGRVTLPGGWSLDWIVGAADRWHEPATAAGTAVTQHRPGGLPVVETSVRVPGGQLVHRCWSTTTGDDHLVVVEVQNRSREAVALGLLVDGGTDGAVAFDGERTLAVRGRPAVRLGRGPARLAVGDPAAVRSVLTSGEAPPPAGATAGPAAGLVFPLAHTAALRVVLAGAGSLPRGVDDLPGADQVTSGWQGHLGAGARIVVPDPRLADAVAAARATLLIIHDRARSVAEAAAIGGALGRWGHGSAAAAALEGLVQRQRLDGTFGARPDPVVTAEVLAAWAALARIAAHPDVAEELAGPAAKAAHRLGRRLRRGERPAWFAAAQLDAAEVLDRARQPGAADLCRERAALQHPAAAPASAPVAAPDLASVAGPEPLAPARFLASVRTALVEDREPPVLSLLGGLPDEWLGQEVEAHRVPTRAGRLSFALRWHGSRPALLWELDGDGGDTVLAVPRLDPSWSSREPAGEALLGPVEPAGGLPAVVAPLAGPATPVDEVPGDGVSFT